VPGDIVFAAGVLYLGWFAVRLLRRGRPVPAHVKPAAQRV
jgi:nitric oxide reductase subunit B